MKKALPIIVYTLVLVMFTSLVASGATMLVMSAVRLEKGDTVTVSQEEYALLQKYSKLDNIMTIIDTMFVEDVDADTLIENAAYGMVELLGDPYSYYLSPESMEAMAEEDSGHYVGIGAVFTTDPNDGMMVCTRIYPNSPAAEGGLQVGDRLYKVNGESILNMPQSDVTGMVRGEEGTDIAMTMIRGDEEVELNMTRRQVDVIDVEYRMLDGDILYIELTSFSTNADKAFDEAISFGKKKDMSAMGKEFVVEHHIFKLTDRDDADLEACINPTGVSNDDAFRYPIGGGREWHVWVGESFADSMTIEACDREGIRQLNCD